jgi:hypothetical protein
MGIGEIVTAPHSPWQNPFAVRLIGSVRRECLNHVVVLTERHLRRILNSQSGPNGLRGLLYRRIARNDLSVVKPRPAWLSWTCFAMLPRGLEFDCYSP